jgi:hypothetical protein
VNGICAIVRSEKYLVLVQMAKHILFFSRRCQHCDAVMKTITNQGDVMNKFVFIEIEKVQRSMIPSCVRSIPSMLVHSDPNQVLSGAGSIITYFKKSNSQGNGPPQQHQYPSHQQHQTPQAQGNELLPSAVDVQGYSSQYSFLDDSERTLNSGNFSYIGGGDVRNPSNQQHSQPRQNAMGGGGGGGGSGPGGRFSQSSGRIDKAAMLDSQYEKMMAARDIGIPGPIKRQ